MVKRITNQQFFAVCEAIRNDRELILKDCESSVQVAKLVGEKLGYGVSKSTAQSACELVGVVLTKKKAKRKQNASLARVLANAIFKLYVKFDEVPPQSLIDAVERLEGHPVSIPTPAVPPVPARSVIDPKTLSVVSGNGKA